MDRRRLEDYFARTPRLAELCTQNGWPDPETLRVEVLDRDGDALLCSVSFEEVIMEGAGCVAGRVDCWGRYRVSQGDDGDIDAELLAGSRG
ncbi:hypothetical protein SVA_0564 [Sulfurifustis variabilis]|uniref:Uncharacterized protein n=1 Tax=Sulfurifustis variabilis TaxID=1675686 RepID=A0A1B4V1K6_9GAMM|nr:hypothetical protein [Sulfurifustis variabilis]BAU47145.1 hypothetical protein SVA_0564 [Sulfurifustis variabilis]